MTNIGRTRTAVHKVIQECQQGPSGAGALSPTSTFSEAAELYLAKVARKREDTTLVEYRARLDSYVLPALGALRLRECTVAQLDRSFDALSERYSAPPTRPSTACSAWHVAPSSPISFASSSAPVSAAPHNVSGHAT
jgi:hypothetical protein